MEAENQPVVQKMTHLLESFHAVGDRNAIFLSCYHMMTWNILKETHEQSFDDNAWVVSLMDVFAGYYFRAIELSDNSTSAPVPWQLAFRAAVDPHTNVFQNLVLGVNAHINFDLMFALVDLLQPEWAYADPQQRKKRYRDHCRVNEVIYHTIDAVQDQVIERYEKRWGLVDRVLGPVDEWAISWLISRWREEVWQNTVHYLETPQVEGKAAITTQVETIAADRARMILGRRASREAFQLF